MTARNFEAQFLALFDREISLTGNFALSANSTSDARQGQTNSVFSEKWRKYEDSEEKYKLFEFQRHWYLKLYGFDSERALQAYLQERPVIFDAGCGLGYKAAWFASLAPESLVIGMDFSEAAIHAAGNYRSMKNLFFVQGDIAQTGLRRRSVDYVSCDQVIMHTESPEDTFSELAGIAAAEGEIACYFYAKKALPRELLDEYFRSRCQEIERDKLWAMAEQLTELGRRLSALKVDIDVPEIPELGIKGGVLDIQRFLYWNFLKCFWNPDLGTETSVLTNFDWYSPSNARRFSEDEVMSIVGANGMKEVFFHAEEACYSGRFARGR